MSDNSRLATTAEVADYLGIPINTLRQWRVTGKGPVAHRVGRHLRFHWADVDTWLDGQRDGNRTPA